MYYYQIISSRTSKPRCLVGSQTLPAERQVLESPRITSQRNLKTEQKEQISGTNQYPSTSYLLGSHSQARLSVRFHEHQTQSHINTRHDYFHGLVFFIIDLCAPGGHLLTIPISFSPIFYDAFEQAQSCRCIVSLMVWGSLEREENFGGLWPKVLRIVFFHADDSANDE